jgi:hypothetical protein
VGGVGSGGNVGSPVGSGGLPGDDDGVRVGARVVGVSVDEGAATDLSFAGLATTNTSQAISAMTAATANPARPHSHGRGPRGGSGGSPGGGGPVVGGCGLVCVQYGGNCWVGVCPEGGADVCIGVYDVPPYAGSEYA